MGFDRIGKFSGEGTVLMAEVSKLSAGLRNLSKEQLLELFGNLKGYLDRSITTVEGHSGTVLLYGGDSIVAFWGPGNDHAQRAFDAACAIAKSEANIGFPIKASLGSGKLAGDYMGMTKQFQVVGPAMAIADRIHKMEWEDKAGIRMSQYTAEQIRSPVDLKDKGSIARKNLEALRIYSWCPANIG